jgi:phage RecT family recombinase
MSSSAIDNVMRMVDVCGGPTKRTNFINTIKKSLPKHIKNPDHFVLMFEGVVNDLLKNPKVTKKETVLPAVYQAAKYGFYPDPAMGLIYFVTYSGEVKYQVGYKGMIQLMYNSGVVKNIFAERVFESEFASGNFYYYLDEKGQHFKHVPEFNGKIKVEKLCYSCAVMNDGTVSFHPMESVHIDKIKALVKARMKGAATPWDNDLFEPEMRKKTAIRRHSKTLPVSIEMQEIVDYEEKIENGQDVKLEIPEELFQVPENEKPVMLTEKPDVANNPEGYGK